MVAEVGQGQVVIFPVMTGFKSKIAREAQAAGKLAASGLQKIFANAGKKIGDQLGKDLSSGFRAGASDFDAASGDLLSKALRLGNGIRQVSNDFRAGYASAEAASSAFTGIAGAVGGLARAVSVVSGEIGRSIGSMSVTIGKAALLAVPAISRPFTIVGQSVSTALAPIGRVVESNFTKVANGARVISSTIGGNLAAVGAKVANGARVVSSTIGGNLAAVGLKVTQPFADFGSRAMTLLAPVTQAASVVGGKVVRAIGDAGSKLPGLIGAGASSMGSALISGVGSLFSSVKTMAGKIGTVLGDAFQSTATIAVGAAGKGLGIALTSGFSELNSIDQAQAKLRGFGHSAESVESIMSAASASVKGTSFGLGEAAATATSAIAAGIRPGEELQGHLKRVASNATAAGVSMDEMGSIFATAAMQTNGVQNDVIQQLAGRGIPIYQALADQLGITADQVSTLAADGKIDFATFSSAAESAAGTVVDEMGGTASGAIDSFWKAIGRIGSSLESELFPKIAPLVNALTTALGPIEEQAGRLGQAIGEKIGPTIDKVTEFIGNLSVSTGGLGGGLSGLTGIIGPLTGAFVALGSGGIGGVLQKIPLFSSSLGGLSGPLGFLGGPIGILVAAFAGLVAVSPELQSALGGLVSGVLSSLGNAFTMLVPVLETLLPVISNLAQIFAGVLAEAIQIITPIFTQLVDMFAGLLVDILPMLVPVLEMLGQTFIQLAEFILPLVAAFAEWLIPVIESLLPVVETVFGTILGVIETALGLVQGVIQTITALIAGDWSGVWEGVKNTAQTLWNGIVDFFSGAVDSFGKIFSSIGDAIKGAFKTAFNAVANFWNSTVGSLGFTVPDWVLGIGGKGWSMPKIALLARGGVIDRATLAVVGEGSEPEAVLPLSTLKGMLREVKSSDSMQMMPVIYVENPFTGEYMLAQMDKRATSAAVEVFNIAA